MCTIFLPRQFIWQFLRMYFWKFIDSIGHGGFIALMASFLHAKKWDFSFIFYFVFKYILVKIYFIYKVITVSCSLWILAMDCIIYMSWNWFEHFDPICHKSALIIYCDIQYPLFPYGLFKSGFVFCFFI